MPILQPINCYLSSSEYSYENVYQKVNNIALLNDNEMTWLLFGALLVELDKYNYRDIIIYNDSRLIEEFNGTIEFLSEFSKQTARDIHNNWKKKFLSLRVCKIDTISLKTSILANKRII